ncbi:hypothetical protein LUX01_07060 [Streptomyces sudanensis]|uniref:hypothetical protein n=1 Tax=Streptomyces sudanensis TaxID=436397 RepID=UPI0020CCF2D4|nr:hypothetical protein [Streptomyces sudanensis]MCP9986492.1 hypothetical protein [Streptomyces sudanensis]
MDPVVGRNGSAAKTARRTDAVRSHLCPGCHSHQYEIGPAHDRVRTWRTEAGEPVGASTI